MPQVLGPGAHVPQSFQERVQCTMCIPVIQLMDDINFSTVCSADLLLSTRGSGFCQVPARRLPTLHRVEELQVQFADQAGPVPQFLGMLVSRAPVSVYDAVSVSLTRHCHHRHAKFCSAINEYKNRWLSGKATGGTVSRTIRKMLQACVLRSHISQSFQERVQSDAAWSADFLPSTPGRGYCQDPAMCHHNADQSRA